MPGGEGGMFNGLQYKVTPAKSRNQMYFYDSKVFRE